MKFIISSTLLSSHLQAVSRVVNSKNTLPILDCFLFELKDGVLSVTASDSETTLVTSVEVAESDGNGRIAVLSKMLLDALKEIPEQPLTFDANPSSLEITILYQNGKCSLMGQDADEYPTSAILSNKAVQVEMDAMVLLNGINRTAFSMGDDDIRQVMNGIFFDITPDDITMVATDGFKLVRYKILSCKGNTKSSFIFPKKPVLLLKSLLSREQGLVKIEFDERNAVFTLSSYRMVCRLIEELYPKYSSVIPTDNPYKATVDRMSLLGALKRVSVFSPKAINLVGLSLSNGKLRISAQDMDYSTSAEETLPCQYTDKPMSIGFNSLFLIDMLNAIPSTEVVLELADPSRVGVVVSAEQEEDEDLLTLLLPIALD